MKKAVLTFAILALIATFQGCTLITASEDVFPKEKVSGPLNTDDEEDEKNKPGNQ